MLKTSADADDLEHQPDPGRNEQERQVVQDGGGHGMQRFGHGAAKREDEQQKDQTEDRPGHRQPGEPRQGLAGELEDQEGRDSVNHVRKPTHEADGKRQNSPGGGAGEYRRDGSRRQGRVGMRYGSIATVIRCCTLRTA